MAVSHKQNTSIFDPSSSNQLLTSFSSNTVVGNAIAVFLKWGSNSVTLISVTDSEGNSYTLDKSATQSGHTAQLAYAVNIIGGTPLTITANFSGTTTLRGMVASEVGDTSTLPFDASQINAQTNPGVGVDAVVSGTITTTEIDEYLFGATSDLSQVNVNPGTGFIGAVLANSGVESEYDLTDVVGVNQATFTQTGTLANFITAIMAFKPSATPGIFPQIHWHINHWHANHWNSRHWARLNSGIQIKRSSNQLTMMGVGN